MQYDVLSSLFNTWKYNLNFMKQRREKMDNKYIQCSILTLNFKTYLYYEEEKSIDYKRLNNFKLLKGRRRFEKNLDAHGTWQMHFTHFN